QVVMQVARGARNPQGVHVQQDLTGAHPEVLGHLLHGYPRMGVEIGDQCEHPHHLLASGLRHQRSPPSAAAARSRRSTAVRSSGGSSTTTASPWPASSSASRSTSVVSTRYTSRPGGPTTAVSAAPRARSAEARSGARASSTVVVSG